MIAHLTGPILSHSPGRATIATAAGVAYEVLLPPYLEDALPEPGQTANLYTVHILETPNQGATFVPRLLGFSTQGDKEIYELLTQVRGLGYRKALRCLAQPPVEVANMIARGDEVGLRRLPEIGAKLAKTLVDELGPALREQLAIDGLEAAARVEPKPANPQADDAVRALIALGETPAEARRKVEAALQRPGTPKSQAAELVAVALGM